MAVFDYGPIYPKVRFSTAVFSRRRGNSWSAVVFAESASQISQLPPRSPAFPLTVDAPRACAGDARSLVENRLRCERPRHFHYLISRLRSREDAEDVLQDFTIKSLQGAMSVREDRIDGWLNVNLRNALFDRYRRAGARQRLNAAAAAEPTEAAPPELVEDLSPLDCLAKSITQLKPTYAIVLRRADLDEASVGDLASELGLTSNNTAVRHHRAREALRQLMRARCSACPTPCGLAAHFIVRSAAMKKAPQIELAS